MCLYQVFVQKGMGTEEILDQKVYENDSLFLVQSRSKSRCHNHRGSLSPTDTNAETGNFKLFIR